MHRHFAYGLNLRSDIPLPGLPLGGDGSDVVIRQGEFGLPLALREETRAGLLVTPNAAYLRCDLGSFHLHAGREITVMPSPGLDPALLGQFVSSVVFGVLLHQRGEFVLHASAIVDGGKVVAFAGESGSGKSAVAAALLARGHAFFADDFIPLRFTDGIPVAYPGVPALKLRPDTVHEMGEDPSAMPLVWPAEEKRLRSIDQGFALDPLLLSRVYVLDHGEVNAITLLPAAQAVYELVRCHYCGHLLHPDSIARRFRQTIALAQSVPCFRLQRIMSLDRLSEVADLVEGHLRRSDAQRHA